MSALTVRGIGFQPLKSCLYQQRPSIEASFEWLSGLIHTQTEQVLAKLSEEERNQIDRHFLCSTMVEMPFTTGDIAWSDVAEKLTALGPNNPDTYINAYECASWGYSLRHYLTYAKAEKKRFLLVSILDANLYDLTFWRYNENWHESGFGITTVLLEVTGEVSNELITQCALTHNSMAEFATVVRRTVTGRDNVCLALPFFPEHIQEMFNKLLAKQWRLPDLHHNWGHCFGSDPWLSILCHSLENPPLEEQKYMAASLALNGYFAMAEVRVNQDTHLILNEEASYE
ncbi:hypothetical protein OA92_11425 [Marinomonas sp. SBI22]|uniref:hypothetical protein n=1 Tax=unclassified Marinomonas TaxID=196814 RepID=UPI0007AF273C|nr:MULTISPECIES: hypothetical protein [unclassified Marinomonas]KZM42519.1 hypothetical protein OA92_11425 [Marinomonas sp. SBI22]KZM43913.1 hypothetical protein OA91_10850 [Marinomonas sp. SBI8L]